MSTQDLPGALAARDRMLKIASDPDLSHEAKLFAFCLLAFLTERRATGRKAKHWAEAVGEMMYPADSSTHTVVGPRRITRGIIADDVPRYETPYTAIRCPVPKARGVNTGNPCGRTPSGGQWIEFDAETGEGTHVGYCNRHITPAIHDARQTRWQAWDDNGKPVPPANKGGILARHFDTDWPALYHWAAPHRVPLAEGKPLELPRPKLALIQGGAS